VSDSNRQGPGGPERGNYHSAGDECGVDRQVRTSARNAGPAPDQGAPIINPKSSAVSPKLLVFLTVFIDLLGFGMVLPLLPIYADQFTVDKSGWQLGLLMASFSIMQACFAPLWGRLSDRIGRRPVLLVGLAGSAAFYGLFGVATVWQSLTWLFVSRIGAGIAGATIPTAQAYIADTTPPEQRSRGMALIGMAFGMGFTFGPLLGYLAVPDRNAQPGPWPGYAAALLSGSAFLLALFLLPESKRPDSESATSHAPGVSRLGAALAVPSVGLILAAIFVCIFSFAKFETTLSLLVKGDIPTLPFDFSWGMVCLTYAFIGITLALVQGGLVRRLSGRVPEGWLATGGALAEIAGFSVVVIATYLVSTPLLFVGLAIVVSGFAFMQPNLQALLSRRSDPERQGLVLGVGQSVSAVARILGSLVGIPLLFWLWFAPYVVAAILMLAGAILVLVAARSGNDYA